MEDKGKLFARVFESGDGKEVLEYLSSLFYDVSVYTKGDSHDTAFKAGQRDVILFILQMIAYVQQPQPFNQGDEE